MNRKCRQNVATDDRRIYTDKDKVHRIQTQGNNNKDAMLDCEKGFKHKLNCHKLRSTYVTSILQLITKLTFAMFLLKLSTLSAAIFLFVSLVLSLLCGRSTGVFHYCFFFFSIRYQTVVDIRH